MYHIEKKGFSVKQNTPQFYKSFEYLALLVSSGSTHPRVIGVYTPPSSRKRPQPNHQFFDEFSSLSYTDASKFADLLPSFCLVQHVSSPTRERGHLLDLIITKHDDDLAIQPSVLSDLPSDHALVTSRITLPRPKPTRVLVNQRHLQQLSADKFAEAIRSTSLVSDYQPVLPSLAMRYNTILRELLDTLAPQRTRYVTFRPHAPWFDDAICKEKLTKRRLDLQVWRLTAKFIVTTMPATIACLIRPKRPITPLS